MSTPAPLHVIDIIRKKRDGGALDDREIAFIANGAANGSIPVEQLSAWLMAAWIRGLSLDETRALTIAMRDSGEKFSPARLGKAAVDKHPPAASATRPASSSRLSPPLRRGRPHDQRARPRPHRRYSRQAGIDPRLPHRPHTV